jgi:proteasome lid subunit RPN8/RPN11
MRIIIEEISNDALQQLAGLIPRPPKKRHKKPKRKLVDIHTVVMARPAYDAAMKHLRWRGREEAGLLIGPANHHWVTHFVPDFMGEGSPGTFTIHARTLNETLSKYVPLGLEAVGVIHAHPPGCRQLSSADVDYAKKLFRNPHNNIDRLLMPIVVDGEIVPYLLFPNDPDTPCVGQLIIQ